MTGSKMLLARADAACYTARDAGRGRLRHSLSAAVEESFTATRTLKDDLQAALTRNEFQMYFQAHVDLKTLHIGGAEALIRWNHPVRGLIPPVAFIPFAERQGTRRWRDRCLGHARNRAQRHSIWRRTDPTFRVWFNLSAAELRDETLVARIRELGDLSGLGVEITESVAMENVAETLGVMNALRKAGVQIALDDFGTGYSSLAHLKRLPIDVVKIDRAFVMGLPNDRFDGAIVDAVLSIARSYGFETYWRKGSREREQGGVSRQRRMCTRPRVPLRAADARGRFRGNAARAQSAGSGPAVNLLGRTIVLSLLPLALVLGLSVSGSLSSVAREQRHSSGGSTTSLAVSAARDIADQRLRRSL